MQVLDFADLGFLGIWSLEFGIFFTVSLEDSLSLFHSVKRPSKDFLSLDPGLERNWLPGEAWARVGLSTNSKNEQAGSNIELETPKNRWFPLAQTKNKN